MPTSLRPAAGPMAAAVAAVAALVAMARWAPDLADLGSALLQVALNAMLLAAALGARRRVPGSLRAAWLFVAGAAAVTVAVILALLTLLAAGRAIPSNEDLWWLLVLVNLLSFLGLLALAPPEIRGAAALRFALDGLIVGTAILFILLAGVEQWRPGNGGADLATLAYPAVDAAVLTLVLLTVSRRRGHLPTWYLLIAGSFALVLATDAVAAVRPGMVLVADGGYYLQLGLATAAARLAAPWPPITASAEHPAAQWAVYVPFGLSVAAAMYDFHEHGGLVAPLFYMAVFSVSLVVVRTIVLLGENARLARQLRASDEFKTQLLRFISHEVANPLSPLRLQGHLLRDGTAKDPRRAWDAVERSIDRLEALSRDVRMMALAETNRLVRELKPTDLAPRVAAAVAAHQAVAEQRGLRLEADVQPATVPVDADRFDQVVDNLLSNALKFTPAGGRLTVRVRDGPPGAVLEVEDTGAGLGPQQLASLFTAFGRAHGDQQPGLGLGLYLCKAIVEGHRGRITAGSAGPGHGATFRVELPQEAQRPSPRLPPRPAYPEPASTPQQGPG